VGSWTSSREAHMGRLLQIVEGALTVTQLAELDLKFADPMWAADRTLAWMRDNSFDAAPLREPEVHRVVIAESLEPNERPVADQAAVLDAPLLVSGDLSIGQGISRLAAMPFYFVLGGDQLRGIVTRADLQRPAVSMIIFSMILASETAMSALIERRLGSNWIEQLKPAAREGVMEIYQSRSQHNTEVTPLECLMLHQRLELLARCPGLTAELSFSGNGMKKWKEQLNTVRDMLAHGGGLLDAQPDPVEAIRLFGAVRSFADQLWRLVSPL
jgi:hypothetical protein